MSNLFGGHEPILAPTKTQKHAFFRNVPPMGRSDESQLTRSTVSALRLHMKWLGLVGIIGLALSIGGVGL